MNKEPSDTAIEILVNELKSSKKYALLHPDTIRQVVTLEAQKPQPLNQVKKTARKKLHLILASYLSELKYAAAEKELLISFAAVDRGSAPVAQEKARETCRMILSKHASSRERIPILTEFYAGIFEITGTPQRVADLGCAMNPFSFRWMGLPRDTHYFAFDNNKKIVQLLSLYLKLESLKSTVEWRDVLVNPPDLSFDVAFLFKMFHCLEHRQRGAGWEVVEKTLTPWIAVSFPTRNLANRKVDIFGNYKESLLEKLKEKGWGFRQLEFDSEIVLVIDKRKGSRVSLTGKK